MTHSKIAESAFSAAMSSQTSVRASAGTSAESRRGRKHLRHEENWARKKRKLAKDKGKSYSTYVGKSKLAKEIADLTCSCPYNCSKNVEEAEHHRIFQEFYQLGDHDAQNKYLYGLISIVGVKRQAKQSRSQHRQHTIVYKVRLADGSHKQVCKKSFCDLHAIGKRHVEKLVEKVTQGILIASDMRGKHKN